jgi:tRNA 2-selenouridine synthase
MLHALEQSGEQILDLEFLANHKGSAFGGIGMDGQPSSEQFQNDLFFALRKLDIDKRIWIEREGMTIGKVYLPQSLWATMNRSRIIVVDVPEKMRVDRLVRQYGSASKEALETSIRKLQQNLGGQNMNAALELLNSGNLEGVAMLLLKYYDKRYHHSQKKYLTNEPIAMHFQESDMGSAAQKLIDWANEVNHE